MSGERGYYRMARGWMDSAMFANEPLCERAAWAWLIEKAAYQPHQVRLGSTMIEVARGQLIGSLRYLAAAWRWQKDRVARFLGVLESANAVSLAKRGNGQTAITVITLCNYDQYQTTRDSDATDLRQTRDSDATKRKKDKEGKKEEDISLEADFEIWYAAYPRKVARPDAFRAYCKARKKVDAATLLAGIAEYRRRKADYADWAHPATWLNKERWLDQPDVAANPSANGSSAASDAEAKARCRGIAKGIHIPTVSDHEVRRYIMAGYLTAEQAVAAGYEP